MQDTPLDADEVAVLTPPPVPVASDSLYFVSLAVESLVFWVRLAAVVFSACAVVLTTTFVWGARAKTVNDSAVAWGILQLAAWAQAHPKP